MRRILLPLVLVALQAQAQQTSVLFIGNSYTYVNDLPNTFRQLALSLGDTVTVSSSAPGGYTFQAHATYQPTLTAIHAQQWDFVVLQEQSQRPAFSQGQVEAQVFPFAAQLVDSIRANDPCSQPVFYMTWGRQNGDADNCAVWPPVCTFQGMNDLLEERYVQMAEDNDAFAAPVGVAWKQVRDTHPFINLYQSDGSHPSPEGTYLAACVFYATVFGEASAPAAYVAGLQADTAAILRGIADAVVLGDPTAWNLDVLPPVDAMYTGSTSPTWNEVTYTHGGAGEHLWTCTNGESFTTPDATFHFAGEGTYSFTHVFTDACGRSDSHTWTVEVVITGIGDVIGGRERASCTVQGQRVQVWAPKGTVLLVDAAGRTVAEVRANGTAAQVLHVDSGAYMWSWVVDGRRVSSGKVIVP